MSLSTGHAGLTPAQRLMLSASTSDGSQVRWNISPRGGSIAPATSASGVKVTLTAPSTAGVYTVTATRQSDAAAASAIVAVTDLAGVYTYHNDLGRSGANDQEYLLTPANVSSSSFGKLFSCVTDGAIYAQPLWVAGLSVAGVKRNVVFVATQHDSVFAFDADQNPCVQLWTASLLDAAHGASAGETTVISAGLDRVVGNGAGSITPETGVTGTPVIDPATGTLYVVSKSMTAGGTAGVGFYQRLHALDLTTGQEKPGSPATITASFPGTGDGGTTVGFNAQTQLQRPGLALVNGTVYIAWASHEDAPPYYGWVIGYTYDGSSFTQASVLDVTPDAGLGGIWMSGAAPASADGRLYLMTGNGVFDADSAAPMPNSDYGDSLLELSPDLQVSQYFAPTDADMGVPQDLDFGAGGAAVLVELPATSSVTHLIIGGSKDGYLYVLNRDALGGKGDQYAWQKLNVGGPILASPAFWNNQLYVGGINAPLMAYQLDVASAQMSLASSSTMLTSGGYFGRTPSVSGARGSGGIVWALNNYQVCTLNTQHSQPAENPCGPAILEAYDATNLQNELWSSATLPADRAGNAVRNAVPVIANGKVYIGTRGDNMGGPLGSTSAAGELDVYGLK